MPAFAQVRAVLVALHVIAITALSLPVPSGGMKRSAWKDPTVQAEISAWGDRLRGLGASWSNSELESHLWSFGATWITAHHALVAPFRPYYRWAGTYQSWRMFVAPHLHPSRLHIDIQDNGVWQTVYAARSEEHTWLAPTLDHDRMRSAIFRYGWPPYTTTYNQLVDWLAVQARRDYPEATHLRTRMVKARTLSPEEARTGEIPESKDSLVRKRALQAP